MIKVHVMWRGMWRCVYHADGWTLAAHGIIVALATIGIVQFLR